MVPSTARLVGWPPRQRAQVEREAVEHVRRDLGRDVVFDSVLAIAEIGQQRCGRRALAKKLMNTKAW